MGVAVDNGPASRGEYVVIYEDFPPSYTKGAPQDFLAARRDTFMKGKTLLSDKAIDLNGIPGREYKASDDQQNYTVRLFLQGSRLYTLFVVSPKGATATQASQFLDSFKIESF
jgi:predicted Zn-dependent protease